MSNERKPHAVQVAIRNLSHAELLEFAERTVAALYGEGESFCPGTEWTPDTIDWVDEAIPASVKKAIAEDEG
jgi:hypothetical protein